MGGSRHDDCSDQKQKRIRLQSPFPSDPFRH